jgi:hypothetical protein
MKTGLTDEKNFANAKSSFADAKPAESAPLTERLFETWEKRTSEYCERLLRNPALLSAVGGLLTSGYKNKILIDKTLTAFWKNLNLPNKRDQERTLHLLNELHSRIFDLEERLAKSDQKCSSKTGEMRGEADAARDL